MKRLLYICTILVIFENISYSQEVNQTIVEISLKDIYEQNNTNFSNLDQRLDKIELTLEKHNTELININNKLKSQTNTAITTYIFTVTLVSGVFGFFFLRLTSLISRIAHLEAYIKGDETYNKKKIKNILIVEDQKSWQNTYDTIFSEQKWKYEIVSSFIEALRVLSLYNFQLAIIDMRLIDHDINNKDGFRLLDKLDKSSFNTKFIIITGYGVPSDIKSISSNNLIYSMYKDSFNEEVLLEKVRTAFNT